MQRKEVESTLEAGFRYARMKAYLPWNQEKPDSYAYSIKELITLVEGELQELYNCYGEMVEYENKITPKDRENKTRKSRNKKAVELAMECGDMINFLSMICKNVELGRVS